MSGDCAPFLPTPAGAGGGGGGGIKSISGGSTVATGPGVSFSNANNVSFGINGNTITASVVPDAGIGLAVPGSTIATGTVVFSASNGVSFGINGSTVTGVVASVLATGTQLALLSAASNASLTAGAFMVVSGSQLFMGGSGVQIAAAGAGNIDATAGSNITLRAANTISVSAGTAAFVAAGANGSVRVGASNNTVGFFGQAGTNRQTITGTNATAINNLLNALGSLGIVSNGATVSGFATGNLGAIAAGTQTATSGTVAMSDSNGISFGMSGSSQITARAISLTGTNGEVVQMRGSGANMTISNANSNVVIAAGGLGDIFLSNGPGGVYLRGDRVEVAQQSNRTVAFYGVAGATRQTVTGTNATAFNNLMNALGSLGIISNGATMNDAIGSVSFYDNGALPPSSTATMNVAAAQAAYQRVVIDRPLSATRLDVPYAFPNTGSLSLTAYVYTINGNTANTISSATFTVSSVSYAMTTVGVGWNFTGGEYFIGIGRTHTIGGAAFVLGGQPRVNLATMPILADGIGALATSVAGADLTSVATVRPYFRLFG